MLRVRFVKGLCLKILAQKINNLCSSHSRNMKTTMPLKYKGTWFCVWKDSYEDIAIIRRIILFFLLCITSFSLNEKMIYGYR